MRSVYSVDSKVVLAPVNRIKPSPWKIRKSRSISLEESIRKYGLQEPIKVREVQKGRYQVIFGDGRLGAVKALGLKTIPAIVYHCTEQEAFVLHGVENLCRNNWSPLEEGEYYSRFTKETGKSLREMEQIFQVSRSQISERIALFEKLTPQAKKAVADQKISPSAVEYALHKLPEEDALGVIEKAVEHKLDFDGVISEVNTIRPTAEIHQKANAYPDHKSAIRTPEAQVENGPSILALEPVSIEMPWLRYVSANAKCPICKQDRAVDFSQTNLSSTSDQLPKIRTEMQRWLDENKPVEVA